MAGPADPALAERAARLNHGGRKALADYIAAQETPRAAGRLSRPTKRSRSKGV
jgi:hypothetical protein